MKWINSTIPPTEDITILIHTKGFDQFRIGYYNKEEGGYITSEGNLIKEGYTLCWTPIDTPTAAN